MKVASRVRSKITFPATTNGLPCGLVVTYKGVPDTKTRIAKPKIQYNNKY